MTATTEANDLLVRDKILGALYKHKGVASKAATEFEGISPDKFRRMCKQHNIDLKGFKDFLRENPEFAKVMTHYGAVPPSNNKGAAKVAFKEAETALQKPSDGRTTEEIEATIICPGCESRSHSVSRTFGLGLFVSRLFECGSSLTRNGSHLRSRKCIRTESRSNG